MLPRIQNGINEYLCRKLTNFRQTALLFTGSMKEGKEPTEEFKLFVKEHCNTNVLFKMDIKAIASILSTLSSPNDYMRILNSPTIAGMPKKKDSDCPLDQQTLLHEICMHAIPSDSVFRQLMENDRRHDLFALIKLLALNPATFEEIFTPFTVQQIADLEAKQKVKTTSGEAKTLLNRRKILDDIVELFYTLTL